MIRRLINAIAIWFRDPCHKRVYSYEHGGAWGPRSYYRCARHDGHPGGCDMRKVSDDRS